jgi:hypothetical protein
MLEKKGITMGVLTQKFGTETHPVAYLSKKIRWNSLRLTRMSKSNSCYCRVSEGSNEDNLGSTTRSSNSPPG